MRRRGLSPNDVYLDVWAPGDVQLPGANPAHRFLRALSFTNSTAVGTWSLVFTGPSTGYVSAPGQVILRLAISGFGVVLPPP